MCVFLGAVGRVELGGLAKKPDDLCFIERGGREHKYKHT